MALSKTLSVAGREPRAFGLNTTLIVGVSIQQTRSSHSCCSQGSREGRSL